MADPQQPGYLRPYQQAVDAHGAGFEALLWASREFQFARFRGLCDIASDLDPRGLGGRIVADLGCGTGDLLGHLVEAGVAPAGYIGVDAIDQMAECCRARAAALRPCPVPVSVVRADFVADPDALERIAAEHEVDCMLFSGSLNTLDQESAIVVLDRAWGALARGAGSRPPMLIFNFLSDAGGPVGGPRGQAYRFDRARMLAWAGAHAAPVGGRAVLREDYLPEHDAAVGLVAQASGTPPLRSGTGTAPYDRGL